MVGKRQGKLLGESVEEKEKGDRVCVWEEETQIKNVQLQRWIKQIYL